MKKYSLATIIGLYLTMISSFSMAQNIEVSGIQSGIWKAGNHGKIQTNDSCE